MNWAELAPYLVGGGSLGAAAIGIFLRKFVVNWSKENVIIQGADTTALMMQNFHHEIKRLADSNEELTRENILLKREVTRLQSILEKLAIKFDIDLSEVETKHDFPDSQLPQK